MDTTLRTEMYTIDDEEEITNYQAVISNYKRSIQGKMAMEADGSGNDSSLPQPEVPNKRRSRRKMSKRAAAAADRPTDRRKDIHEPQVSLSYVPLHDQ